MQNSQLTLLLIVVIVIVVIWVWSRCQLKCDSSEKYRDYIPGIGSVSPVYAASTPWRPDPSCMKKCMPKCDPSSTNCKSECSMACQSCEDNCLIQGDYNETYCYAVCKNKCVDRCVRGGNTTFADCLSSCANSNNEKPVGIVAPKMKACPPGCHYSHQLQSCQATFPNAHKGYTKETVRASIPGSTLNSFGVGVTAPQNIKTDVIIY